MKSKYGPKRPLLCRCLHSKTSTTFKAFKPKIFHIWGIAWRYSSWVLNFWKHWSKVEHFWFNGLQPGQSLLCQQRMKFGKSLIVQTCWTVSGLCKPIGKILRSKSISVRMFYASIDNKDFNEFNVHFFLYKYNHKDLLFVRFWQWWNHFLTNNCWDNISLI